VNSNDLWLYTPNRQKISTWTQTNWINVSSTSKVVNGQRFTDWLATQVVNKYLINGEFDGVFYDNLFDNIQWASNNIDINNDGKIDSTTFVNQKWKEGVINLINKTQSLAPNKIVMGNTNTNFYNSYMNGRLMEHFPRPQEGGWVGSMQAYLNSPEGKTPKLFILNANNKNNANALLNLRNVRFTYGSSLLGDGFYSYTIGDQSQSSLWWYDEYNVFLGDPIDPSLKSVSNGVLKREFDNGVVYINSSTTDKTITLNGEYEKIKGIQDPAFNNGAIVRKVTLSANDGIVLQKRINEIKNSVYINGSFVKPFNKYGNETDRNGFFVFDNKFSGNVKIMEIDIDKNGSKEKIVATKNKITIYNNDQSVKNSFYPYGTSYNYGINFDIADVNGDGKLEIVTGTGRGYEPLVKVFDFNGNVLNKGFYAYAKTYKGGVNVALADLNGNGTKDIVVGAGYMGGPQVRIFNGSGKLVSGGFFAYNKNFRGGVNIATGDIDGDGIDEIITGAGIGGSTHVRMFNGKTKPLNPGFFAYGKNSRNGVKVFVADLDNNGIDEILAANPNPFN